jgi:predicted SAM-dependent methyltransferase
MTTRRLIIGSGSWQWADWISLDGDPHSPADIVAMVPPLPELVTDHQWAEILASHFIEHLTKSDALILLKQCYEILVPNGLLTLEQPNIAYCCQIILELIDPPEGRSREQFGLQGILGLPDVHPLMGHKWGYTPAALSDLVVEAGFDRDKIEIGAGVYHEKVRDFTLKVTK